MNSCFALRIVTFWELWGLPAVCDPPCTADARNVRKVWFSESSNTSSWHRQRLRRRRVKWLFPLALGTHVCSPKMEGKPHLRFTCFSPGHVEKAATPFSRPKKFVHMGATAYIDEQSPSDEAVSRRRPNMQIPDRFFSCFGLQQLSILNCVLTNTFAEQDHFPTISSGVRTPDTCKNIIGNVQFSEGMWKIRVRSRSHRLRSL